MIPATPTLKRIALILSGWLALLLALAPLADLVREDITRRYLYTQDRWLLAGATLVWALGLMAALRWRSAKILRFPPWIIWTLAAALCALCWAGHYGLLSGYSLSRDEQMVDFDAAIYAKGLLAWPVPPEWRADLPALNTLFTLPIARPVAWVSAYLPGNAMFHAALGAAAGPLWMAIAVLALWAVARQLFGRDGETIPVALILFALSGQVLFSAMTVFAMPAHLALNLVWLWLFLRSERRADCAAILIGFVATGLHQPLFHPMFVAPWIALLLWERRWGRAALFISAYAAISFFWLWWPHITRSLVMGPDSLIIDAGSGYLSRLLDTLAQQVQNGPLMAANLLRLAAWSHPAIWPLAALGVAAAWKDPRALALLVGLALPLAFMGLVLPYQGHGFGYRYLHPVFGNAVLLAAYGWQSLGSWQLRLRPALITLSIGTALILLPAQAYYAHRLYDGFAQVSAKIDAAPADYVMIGSADAPLSLDLVHNRADLANRPLRLSENDIEDIDRLTARLCQHGETIALPRRTLFFPLAQIWHVYPGYAAEKRLTEARALFAAAGCRVIELN